MHFDKEKCAMIITKSGKTNNGRNRTAKSRKNQNTWKKENIQIFGVLMRFAVPQALVINHL